MIRHFIISEDLDIHVFENVWKTACGKEIRGRDYTPYNKEKEDVTGTPILVKCPGCEEYLNNINRAK